MNMINPIPASASPHHQYHQGFSKQQFSCNRRVYVVPVDNHNNNNNSNKEDRLISVMSRIEEDDEGGYGCTNAGKLDFKLEPESTNHQIGRRSDSESEEEEKDHQQHNLMANHKDDSRTNENTVNETTTASASTSLLLRDAAAHDHQDDEKWLQLSIGGSGFTAAFTTSSNNGSHDQNLGDINHQSSSTTSMVKLDLLPGSSSTRANTTAAASSSSMFHVPEFGAHLALRPPPFANIVTTKGGGNGNGNGASSSSNYYNYYSSSTNNTSLFMPQYHHHDHHGDQIEINWGGSFRPFHHQTNILSSSSRLVPMATAASASAGSYFAPRPFLFHAGLGLAEPPPRQSTIDFRVVDPPPRRPFSGIWFMLQAAHNQAKEPFLPQIPKSFLRIKDGKMTIRLVMKYLAKKLKLEDESEVEIKCRGQQMEPALTLQHVRDCIWTNSPNHIVTLLPESSPADHVMVLQYGRST